MGRHLLAAASSIAELVPPGDSVVHRLPAEKQAEVWLAMAAWVVEGGQSRRPFTDVAREVMDMTPELEFDVAIEDLRKACERYVTRALALHLMPDLVFRGLVAADHDLNILRQKMDKLEKLGKLLDKAYGPESKTGLKDIALLQRAYTQLADSVEASQQALGISPQPVKKVETLEKRTSFNIKATLDRLQQAPAPAAMDAAFKAEPAAPGP